MALTEFDPNDPYGYSYDANAVAIKRRQALAEALRPGQLQGATPAGRRFLAPTTNAQMYGNILQNIIAAYAGATTNNEADANEKARKAQLDAYYSMDPDKAAKDAASKHAAENPYVPFAQRPAGYTPGGHDDPDRPDKGWGEPPVTQPAAPVPSTPAPAKVLPQAQAVAQRDIDTRRGANVAALRQVDNATVPTGPTEAQLFQKLDAVRAEEKQVDAALSTFSGQRRQQDPAGYQALAQKKAALAAEAQAIENQIAPAAGVMRQSFRGPGAAVNVSPPVIGSAPEQVVPQQAAPVTPQQLAAPVSSRPPILPPPGGPQPGVTPVTQPTNQPTYDAGAELEGYYKEQYKTSVLSAAKAAQAKAAADQERLFNALSTSDQDRILKRAALAQKEGYTLKPGEVRFDGNGRPIAALPDNTRQGKATGTIIGADGQVYQTWDDGRAPTPTNVVDNKVVKASEERQRGNVAALEQIDYNMKKIDEFLPMVDAGTGPIGAISNFTGKLFNVGTDSRIANERLNSLKGMLLASAMALTKEQSGTAAGLSQQESQALQASIASLDMSIGAEELTKQLLNVRTMLADRHARVKAELGAQGGGQGGRANVSPSGIAFPARGN